MKQIIFRCQNGRKIRRSFGSGCIAVLMIFVSERTFLCAMEKSLHTYQVQLCFGVLLIRSKQECADIQDKYEQHALLKKTLTYHQAIQEVVAMHQRFRRAKPIRGRLVREPQMEDVLCIKSIYDNKELADVPGFDRWYKSISNQDLSVKKSLLHTSIEVAITFLYRWI